MPIFAVVVYEAGKGIKTGTSTPQSPVYPPYFVSGVPTMVPIAPPSLVDKMSSIPPSDGSLLPASEALFFICFWSDQQTVSVSFSPLKSHNSASFRSCHCVLGFGVIHLFTTHTQTNTGSPC